MLTPKEKWAFKTNSGFSLRATFSSICMSHSRQATGEAIQRAGTFTRNKKLNRTQVGKNQIVSQCFEETKATYFMTI